MQQPITVEVLINAPIEKIWDVFTNPEHITKWCHASDDWYAPDATNDLKVGGRFSTTMAAKDGSVSFEFSGIYTVVLLNQKIEYMMEDGRKVSVEFVKQDDGYKVIETFDPETENPLEMQRVGWQAILDNFKKCVMGE